MLSPVAWFRLWKWGIGFAFEVTPTMAVTALPRHHPDQQADPSWMTSWLSTFDPATGTIPVWDAPIEHYELIGATGAIAGDRALPD